MSNYPPAGYSPSPMAPPPAPAPGPRRYSIFPAIFLAPFSTDLWRDVGRNWRGIGLVYMLLLLILTWIPVMIKGYLGFSTFVNEEAPKLVDQVPPITITDGVAKAEATMPHYITDPKTNQPIAIIDTREDGIAELPEGIVMLLTPRELIVNNNGRIESRNLSEIGSFSLDSNRIKGWLNTVKSLFLPVILPLMIVLSLIWRLILMLIFGAIGLGFAAAFSVRLPFSATMRLAAIAMTPGILLGTILGLVGFSFGCFGLILYLGLLLGYLAFVIKANATDPPRPWDVSPSGYGTYPPAPQP